MERWEIGRLPLPRHQAQAPAPVTGLVHRTSPRPSLPDDECVHPATVRLCAHYLLFSLLGPFHRSVFTSRDRKNDLVCLLTGRLALRKDEAIYHPARTSLPPQVWSSRGPLILCMKIVLNLYHSYFLYEYSYRQPICQNQFVKRGRK